MLIFSALSLRLKKYIIPILLIVPLEILAAPSDHGRIYHDNSPLSIVLGFILVSIVLIGWIFSKIPSNKDKSLSYENQQSNKIPHIISDRQYILCPECQGLGYRNKKIKSHNTPGEYIECDCCKGYKHKLNEEAERLLIDYYREFNREQEAEFNRREEEARRKRELEREVEKQRNRIKQEIINEGRNVYSLDEYNDKIYKLCLKRNDLTKKFQEFKPQLTICNCLGNNKHCPKCYGTRYVFNDELQALMSIYQSSIEERRILTSDRNRIYGEPQLGVADFSRMFRHHKLVGVHSRSSQISKRIASLVENMPICQECMGDGLLKVIDSEYRICEYHITVVTRCLRCGGTRWIKSPKY